MKRLIFLIILISSLFIINNLVRSIVSLWQKQDLLIRAKSELLEEKKQNLELKKRLTEVKSPSFIEKEARTKLFLTKENEVEVVLPKNLGESTPSAKKQEDTRPNWQKWLKLFF